MKLYSIVLLCFLASFAQASNLPQELSPKITLTNDFLSGSMWSYKSHLSPEDNWAEIIKFYNVNSWAIIYNKSQETLLTTYAQIAEKATNLKVKLCAETLQIGLEVYHSANGREDKIKRLFILTEDEDPEVQSYALVIYGNLAKANILKKDSEKLACKYYAKVHDFERSDSEDLKRLTGYAKKMISPSSLVNTSSVTTLYLSQNRGESRRMAMKKRLNSQVKEKPLISQSSESHYDGRNLEDLLKEINPNKNVATKTIKNETNHRTELERFLAHNEWAKKNKLKNPCYLPPVLEGNTYKATVTINDYKFIAEALNKKKAQQNAAKVALEKLSKKSEKPQDKTEKEEEDLKKDENQIRINIIGKKIEVVAPEQPWIPSQKKSTLRLKKSIQNILKVENTLIISPSEPQKNTPAMSIERAVAESHIAYASPTIETRKIEGHFPSLNNEVYSLASETQDLPIENSKIIINNRIKTNDTSVETKFFYQQEIQIASSEKNVISRVIPPETQKIALLSINGTLTIFFEEPTKFTDASQNQECYQYYREWVQIKNENKKLFAQLQQIRQEQKLDEIEKIKKNEKYLENNPKENIFYLVLNSKLEDYDGFSNIYYYKIPPQADRLVIVQNSMMKHKKVRFKRQGLNGLKENLAQAIELNKKLNREFLLITSRQ